MLIDFLSIRSIVSTEAAHLLSSMLVPRPGASITTPTLLPDTIVALIAHASISAILNSAPDTDPAAVLRVLTVVQQRWPAVWEAETRARTVAANEEAMPLLWDIMNSVLSGGSLPKDASGSKTSASTTMFLASTSPDVSVRILALQDVFKAAQQQDSALSDSFLHDTLAARLSEPRADVQRVVLAPETLPILHKTLTGDEILRALTVGVLSSSDTEAQAVVLAYLANAFVDTYPTFIDAVLKTVFWSRLLASKSGDNDAARAALAGSSVATRHEWLASGDSSLLSTAGDAESNGLLLGQLAQSIAAQKGNSLQDDLAFLLDGVSDDTDNQAQLVSLLVSAQLVGKLDKTHRNEFVSGLVAALRATELGLDAFASAPNEAEDVVGAVLSQTVFGKPRSFKTTRRAKAAVLNSAIAALQPPKGSAWQWLDDATSSSYQDSVTAIYRLAHTGTSPAATSLSTSLLRSLFSNLVTADTLAFLASIYTDTSTPSRLKTVALQDAHTFVAAQILPVDFQTCVPSALVALVDGGAKADGKAVRSAAIDLLSAVHDAMPPKTTAATEVYARDVFYGSSSSSLLKYLDAGDVNHYLSKLLAAKTELSIDGAYLNTVHNSLLVDDGGVAESSHSKKHSLKFKIATFLVSHVQAWQSSLRARAFLLRSVRITGADGKAQALILPVLEQLVSRATPEARSNMSRGVEETIVNEFGRSTVMGSFEHASKKWMESTAGAFESLAAALELSDLAGELSGAQVSRRNSLLTKFGRRHRRCRPPRNAERAWLVAIRRHSRRSSLGHL